MNSLTDVYDTISAADADLLEKQAEAIKVAEEEDAAGRIMARGFMDELHKLAQPMAFPPGGKPGNQFGSAAYRALPKRSVGGTQMAEAKPAAVAKVPRRAKQPSAPQTREQAIGHAKGIANMVKQAPKLALR